MSRWGHKRTPERMEQAARLKAEGLDYEAIGKIVGATGTTVHCWLDAEFAANRRRIVNAARQGKYTTPAIHRIEIRPSPEDIERGFRAIPKDTRDLTAQLCGDPLPGRRAIDNWQSIGTISAKIVADMRLRSRTR